MYDYQYELWAEAQRTKKSCQSDYYGVVMTKGGCEAVHRAEIANGLEPWLAPALAGDST